MKRNEYQMKQNGFYDSENEEELLEFASKMNYVSQQIIDGIRDAREKKNFEGDSDK